MLPYLRTAKRSRTAYNRPCTEKQSTHCNITVVSNRVRQRKFAKQAGMKKQVKFCRRPYTSTRILCFFSPLFSLFLHEKIQQLIWIRFQVPLSLSPVTGGRLDDTIFSVDTGVTDVTHRLFAVTSSTCSTLLLAVRVLKKLFFPPIDIQHYIYSSY